MYIIEGNIGVGKSTFLTILRSHFTQITLCQEPLYNWQKEVHGASLLSCFYQDPFRWAYSLENFAMICRFKEYKNEQKKRENTHILFERSFYSGYYCFALNGYQSGFLTELEWQIYSQWFSFLVLTQCPLPKGFIYLKSSPEIAFDRIQKRARAAEKEITIEYIRQINSLHDKFLIEKENILPELKKVPVLILDCNQEFEKDETIQKLYAQKIGSFLSL